MMPSMEFNRKVSNEKELEKSEVNHHCNIIFDSTGHFIMYATMIGIKLVNLYTNKGEPKATSAGGSDFISN